MVLFVFCVCLALKGINVRLTLELLRCPNLNGNYGT